MAKKKKKIEQNISSETLEILNSETVVVDEIQLAPVTETTEVTHEATIENSNAEIETAIHLEQISNENEVVVIEDVAPTNLVTDRGQIKQVLEAVIFAAPRAITLLRLKNILTHFNFQTSDLKEILEELVSETSNRGFQLVKVAGGYQYRSHPEHAEVLQKLLEDKPARLGGSALEALAIVAYKQPVTRSEIDSVRGVDSGHLMKGLLEKNLIRTAGHAETPGRPLLYGTTPYFLEVFSLNSLDDLPAAEEFKRELAPTAGDGTDDFSIDGSGLASEPDRGNFDPSPGENEEAPDFGLAQRAREEFEQGQDVIPNEVRDL